VVDQRDRDQRAISRAFSRMSRILGNTGHPQHDHEHHGRQSIVDCAVYVDGQRRFGSSDYGEALAAARRTHGFVWLGLHEPDEEELDHVAAVFDLHELPVEDAIKGYQRPKIERYAPMTFAALRTVRYVEHSELTEDSEIVETGHVMLFVGRDFVITVRKGQPTDLAPVRANLEERPEMLAEGPWAVAHAIYDRVVDSYLDTAALVEADIDELEDMVFSRDNQARGTRRVQRIYQLKRELVEFKRAVLPLQRPLADLSNGSVSDVPAELRRYFRDVNDHLSRTVEQIVSFDDLLNSILQARLAQVSVEQNDDMRKIAAWAGIAAVWTAVAGIYGMNFKFIPELTWRYGYPAVLSLCLLASVVLYRSFRKSGWL
jgi:magnesium transporter